MLEYISHTLEQADIQRNEAKRLLLTSFRLGVSTNGEIVGDLIDCVISAAILEMAAIQQEATRLNGAVEVIK